MRCSARPSRHRCAAEEEAGRWSFDSTLLYYGESDDRVQDISAAVSAQRDFGDERKLSATLTADTLDRRVRERRDRARPAADVHESIGPRRLHDRRRRRAAGRHVPRHALRAECQLDPAARAPVHVLRRTRLLHRVRLHAPRREPVARARLQQAQHDAQRRRRLVAGRHRSGRRRTDAAVADARCRRRRNKLGGSDSKDVLDLLLGFTQVLNRTTVLRVNYSYSDSSGYLNDPYKILSVVDPLTGDTLTRAPVGQGPDGVYLFESRPDSRAKHSLYAEVKHAFGKPVLHFAYRFMTDDWGIDSHTGEVRLRWPLGDGYIEPQLRYYTQSAADFYRASLVSGAALPRYASADFRLGDFDATTVGMKYGHGTASGNEWSIRAEYYQQNG